MTKKMKIVVLVLVMIGIATITILAFMFALNKHTEKSADTIDSKVKTEKVFCTQDAKQCADGSFVSRTGPNCEFAPCPNKTTPPQVVGGQCEYSKISGNCNILSLSPDNNIVKFNFSTIEPLPDNPLTKNIKGEHSDTMNILNNQNLSIKVGDKINCEANMETKGTCTPVIFKFTK
jgi:hypothetical protein